jgi:hypothetical protein
MRARVMDTKEFVDWFSRQVGGEMGCRVRVLTVGVRVDGVIVVFRCKNRRYIAKVRVGHDFSVSLYEYVYESGRFVGIERYELRGNEIFNVYDESYGFSNNALFYVEDGVNIDVYELQSETQ